MGSPIKGDVDWNSALFSSDTKNEVDHNSSLSAHSISQSESLISTNHSHNSHLVTLNTVFSGQASIPSLLQPNVEKVQSIAVSTVPFKQQSDVNIMHDPQEQNWKMRREIANGNERRRMQSINAGFNSLKAILPKAGEKLSKATVLRQTADYVLQLSSEKAKFMSLNERYRAVLSECKCESSMQLALLTDRFEKDEGIGSPREEDMEDIRREAAELRRQLDHEKRRRIQLEDKVCELELLLKRKAEQNVQMQSHQVAQISRHHGASIPPVSYVMKSIKNELETPQPSNSSNVPCINQSPKRRSLDLSQENESFFKSKMAKVQETSPVIKIAVPRSLVVTPQVKQTQNVVLVQSPSRGVVLSQLRGATIPSLQTSGMQLQAKLIPAGTAVMNASTAKHMLPINSIALPINTNQPPSGVISSKASVPAVSSLPSSILQPTADSHPEEMTLNQLNSVSSLSMTLTQLNALPNATQVAASSSAGNPAQTLARAQTQFLPVAMDKVLTRVVEKVVVAKEVGHRVSKAETSVAQSEHEYAKVVPAKKSSTNPVSSPVHEIPDKPLLLAEITAGISSPLSYGSGSPSYGPATRSSLETIVQAIDHLEQQERRNSQDQQTNER